MLYAVIALTIISLALWFGMNYKNFADLRGSIAAAANKVKEHLKRRHQAVTKFTAALSDELSKQPELSKKLKEALDKAAVAEESPLKSREECENELGDCLGRLLQSLQEDEQLYNSDSYGFERDSVLDVEDSLTISVQEHNDLVVRFNHQRQLFPVSVMAKRLASESVGEFEFKDVFSRYPLKIKLKLPTPRKSVIPSGILEPESKENSSQ
jgi:hypothetical protein